MPIRFGYLITGAILGPLLFNAEAVRQVAELGVALLLFSIGLEFSFTRLKNLGAIALFGGTLQVLVTLTVFCLVLLPSWTFPRPSPSEPWPP